jgi:hypothetical protein
MNCEFQILYEAAGKVESIAIVARSKGEAVKLFNQVRPAFPESFGAVEVVASFVRFVPNGLPGDGLDLEQFADYLGDSPRTARRMLAKVSHIKSGARVAITIAALEEFERTYTLKAA